MYICSSCGVTLPENASFCPNCGIELSEQNRSDAPTALEPTARPSLPEETTDEIIGGVTAAQAAKGKDQPKKKKKWKLHAAHFLLTLPLILVLVVAVLAVIAFSAIIPRPENNRNSAKIAVSARRVMVKYFSIVL